MTERSPEHQIRLAALRRAIQWRPRCWQNALLVPIGAALIFAPEVTGEYVHPHAALIGRTLAMLLVIVSLWTLTGDENVLPDSFDAVLGAGFVIAAFAAPCVPAHQTTSAIAGAIVIALSSWALLLALNEKPGAAPPRATRFAPLSERLLSGVGSRARTERRTAENVATWSAASWN